MLGQLQFWGLWNIQVVRSGRQLDVRVQYRTWEGDFQSEDLNLGIIRMEALTRGHRTDELTQGEHLEGNETPGINGGDRTKKAKRRRGSKGVGRSRDFR